MLEELGWRPEWIRDLGGIAAARVTEGYLHALAGADGHAGIGGVQRPGRHCRWTTVTEVPTAAPGWYPDPASPTLQRYWNGAEWTESTAPLVMQPFAPVTASSPGPAETPGVYAPPQGRWGLGDVGWLVLVVVGSLLLGVVAGVVALGLDSDVFTPDGNLDLGHRDWSVARRRVARAS